MQTWNSFLQTVFQFVKSLFVNVSKRIYRNAAVLATGMAVVTVVTFVAGDFGGGGTNALVAFAETPTKSSESEADLEESPAAVQADAEGIPKEAEGKYAAEQGSDNKGEENRSKTEPGHGGALAQQTPDGAGAGETKGSDRKDTDTDTDTEKNLSVPEVSAKGGGFAEKKLRTAAVGAQLSKVAGALQDTGAQSEPGSGKTAGASADAKAQSESGPGKTSGASENAGAQSESGPGKTSGASENAGAQSESGSGKTAGASADAGAQTEPEPGKAVETSKDASQAETEAAKEAASGSAITLSDKDYNVLLRIVEAESGGCDVKGRILVANVILNRVESREFPNTVTGVVYEKSQFSPVADGSLDRCKVTPKTVEAVDRALAGEDYSQGALYFMNRKKSSKKNVRWFDSHLDYLFRHGSHEFFK